MIKAFLKQNISSIALVFSSLVMFAIVFGLFQLGWEIYWIAAGLILLLLVLYLIYQSIYFRREKNLEDQVNELVETLNDERNNNRLMRQDIEEYFLLWVHQIKTPITASYLLLAEEDFENKSLLQQEVLKIENYSNMALNYLKIQNPSTDMNFSRISIDELIRPLLKKYRIQFIQSKITLYYSKEATTILTEPNLTSLMIEQILNNALKYTTDTIWIEFDQCLNQLSIKDNGKGIKVEDQQKIFDKGYAGMNGQLSTKSSGIGLYLVKLISKRLEQTTTVHSIENQGSKFIMQLSKD